MFIALRIVIDTPMLYLSSAGSCDIQHTGPHVVPCRSEQRVSDILSALLLSVEECLRDKPVSDIQRVSVCGQMHGVMLWCKGQNIYMYMYIYPAVGDIYRVSFSDLALQVPSLYPASYTVIVPGTSKRQTSIIFGPDPKGPCGQSELLRLVTGRN